MFLNLFLSGDVMLGRGIDQLFMYKNDPILYESVVTDARFYIPYGMKKFAETGNYVDDTYIWGDLLDNDKFVGADFRIINLETSITISKEREYKAVLYKMHPGNIGTLKVARIDYCSMANNHIMDWGIPGLVESIKTLEENKIPFGGIGWTIQMAWTPYIFNFGDKKIYLFSYGDVDSGIPSGWRAGPDRPGVNVVNTSDPSTKINVAHHIINHSKNADFIIVSIHWGSNWGFGVPPYHEEFAHYLIDHARVDLIHGHSSHHFRPIEIYNNKLVLYGCGDLINDYETIDSIKNKIYLSDVSLAYFPSYNLSNKKLDRFILVPYTMRNMKLVLIPSNNINNIIQKLNEISKQYNVKFGTISGEIILELDYITTNILIQEFN